MLENWHSNRSCVTSILKGRDEITRRRLACPGWNTLVQFCVNMPGLNKNCYPAVELHHLGAEFLRGVLPEAELCVGTQFTAAGPFLILGDALEAITAKRLILAAELRHPLSRFWDFDVFDLARQEIRRANLGVAPRRCWICDSPAKRCVAARAHEMSELVAKVRGEVDAFLRVRNGVYQDFGEREE